MKMSQYFLPLLKEIPADATVKSHQLMLRAGMIRQNYSGVYTFLPLGHIVLEKIEKIIQEELDKAGCIRITMPTIQEQRLWDITGRSYGKETLRIKDRHENDLLYSPTAEELVVDTFKSHVKSYKQMPLNLYQINWKFRDEIRPRFGLMRCREFLMMDSYSFDINKENAFKEYHDIYIAYLNIFKRLQLDVIPMLADSGEIGGDLSHEFHVLANYGESTIYYDEKLEGFDFKTLKSDEITKVKAFTEEKKPDGVNLSDFKSKRGIEVGHIFYCGDKYTKAMDVLVQDQNGKQIHPEMCTFGLGLGRIMASIVEASHDENGIIWPENVSPFDYILLNLDPKNKEISDFCEKKYQELKTQGFSVLYDDREVSVGEKLNCADLIGISKQIIVGKKYLENKTFEIKDRKTKVSVTYNS